MFENTETLYRLLVQSVTDYAIYMLNPDGAVASWNAGAERAKGYRADEIVGCHVSRFYSSEDQTAGIADENLAAARDNGRFEDQAWRYRKDGSRFWASVVIHAIRLDGELVGYAKITRDCTEKRQQADALRTMATDLRLALSFLPYGACLLDGEARIVLCNPNFAQLFGLPDDGGPGASLIDLLRERVGSEREAKALDFALFVRQPHRSDATFAIEWDGRIQQATLRSTEGRGWVATFEDVTLRRLGEQAALHRTRHDSLTGLANRDALNDHLDVLLTAPEPMPPGTVGRCAVFYLDIDRFKAVNDTQGHRIGDCLIQEVANRLSAAVRPGDFACRLEGDEFIVVARGSFDADQADTLGQQLRTLLAKPLLIENRVIDIGVSVGIACSGDHGSTPTELISNADIALYNAKRNGGGVCLYDRQIGLTVLARRTLELRLCQALGSDEFSLVYQPICSTDGQAVMGFEALIRWTQSTGVMISPAEFIPLAEELGLMAEIGGWVLETACREAASWPPHLIVAVNVSATQMHDRRFIDRVNAALNASGLDPRRLEVEITETAMITDHGRTLSILTHLRKMGVLIAIDDFGTGYSSLSFLQTLPFTRLKIDRSFVRDLTTNSQSMAIVRGVMRMSHDLGLKVTAEGVETEEQRLILAGEACQEVQGYLFAKPMADDQIGRFLTSFSGKGPSLPHSAPLQIAQ